MKIKLISFFILLFVINNVIFSQKITGKIIDSQTNEPLNGAVIYYDNTSIWTTADENGEFSIPYKIQLNTPLVFSFIGYKITKINNYKSDKKLLITLDEKTEVLDEVIIKVKNAWSKESMLKEFLKLYLGDNKNGLTCKLLNPEDVVLSYNSKTKKLRARAKAPLIIRNVNLKYIVTIDLNVFEANYSYVSENKKSRKLDFIYYSGSNFYKSIQLKPTKETLKFRKKAYEGSVLHFMRSIVRQNLKKEGYKIIVNGVYIDFKRCIEVIKLENGYSKVRFKVPFSVIYKNQEESQIESLTEYFYIDSFGNHVPASLVKFAGELGNQRIGDSLPLDYIH